MNEENIRRLTEEEATQVTGGDMQSANIVGAENSVCVEDCKGAGVIGCESAKAGTCPFYHTWYGDAL